MSTTQQYITYPIRRRLARRFSEAHCYSEEGADVVLKPRRHSVNIAGNGHTCARTMGMPTTATRATVPAQESVRHRHGGVPLQSRRGTWPTVAPRVVGEPGAFLLPTTQALPPSPANWRGCGRVRIGLLLGGGTHSGRCNWNRKSGGLIHLVQLLPLLGHLIKFGCLWLAFRALDRIDKIHRHLPVIVCITRSLDAPCTPNPWLLGRD